MSERAIARNLLSRARASQRPKLLFYFAARALNRLTGVRLVPEFILAVGPLRFVGSVSGMSGLVFLDQIQSQRTYDFPGIRAEGVIFDVGANCGFFALVYCGENPTATAHCFEPHPRTFEKLEANARVNGLASRMSCHQVAVGSQAGACEIEVGELSSMAVVAGRGAKLTDSHGAAINTTRVAVPLITLDRYAQKSGVLPDLIKVDVEGFEVEVLRGASRCLAAAKYAIVEADGEDSAIECGDILSHSGFAVTRRGSILFAIKPK
jgi:FkbM family methyltransferase